MGAQVSAIQPSSPTSMPVPRRIWIVLAVMASTIAALAGLLAWKTIGDPVMPLSAASSVDVPQGSAALPPVAAAPVTADDEVEPPRASEAARPAPAQDAAPPRARPAPAQRPAAPVRPSRAQALAVCTHCGIVESVAEVRQPGQATGLGAAAGGVLGGVVGHQVGGGRGRDAMTVIGAIGGGLAGHEVEKRVRGSTAYAVRVRMDDGSIRTVTQASAPAVGAKVTVDGPSLRPR